MASLAGHRGVPAGRGAGGFRRPARALANGLARRSARRGGANLPGADLRPGAFHQPLVAPIRSDQTDSRSPRAAQSHSLGHGLDFPPTPHCGHHAASACRPGHHGFSARLRQSGGRTTSPDAIAHYNAIRPAGTIGNPITAFQVDLQMVASARRLRDFSRRGGGGHARAKKTRRRRRADQTGLFLAGAATLQVLLGAATIWTNKAADVATGHVMVGALALLTGALWCLVAARRA